MKRRGRQGPKDKLTIKMRNHTNNITTSKTHNYPTRTSRRQEMQSRKL